MTAKEEFQEEIEEKILTLISERDNLTQSDLQGILSVVVREAVNYREDPITMTPNEIRIAHEHRVIAGLIAHLIAHGFTLSSVDDGLPGVTTEKVSTPEEALEAITAVDEAKLFVEKRIKSIGVCMFGITFDMNDPESVVSDWSKPVTDTFGFKAAMDSFDAGRV